MNVYLPRTACSLQMWAILAIYGFAFFAPFSIAIGQIFQAFMLFVTCIFLYMHWSRLKSSPLVWLTLTYILYVTGRGVIAAWIVTPDMEPTNWLTLMDASDLSTAHWKETFRWVRAGPVSVFLVAITLAATGNWLRHSLGILAILFVGFSVLLTQGFAPGEFWQALQGGVRYRDDLNVFIDAFKLVTAILCLFAFAPFLLRASNKKWFFCLKIVAWLLLLVFVVAMIIAMESRSIWIAGLAGMLALVICVATQLSLYTLKKNNVTTLTICIGLILIVGIILTIWQPITKRWNQGGAGSTFIEAIHTSPWQWGDKLPDDSVGKRAALVSVALNLYIQRPIVGYGPADPRYLRERVSRIPSSIKNKTGHFHNIHLEFLLNFGIIGYSLLAITFFVTFYEARYQINKDLKTRMLGIFIISFLVSLFVFGFTTVHFERFKMVHFYGTLLGTLWAGAIYRRLDR